MPVQTVHPELLRVFSADTRRPRRARRQHASLPVGPGLLTRFAVLDVASHLEAFRHGGAYLLPESCFHHFVKGRATLGDPTGQFMATCAAMDWLVAACAGHLALLKQWLGIPEARWNEPLYRVDVHEPLRHGARLPRGSERGANGAFRRGGFTIGGIPEIVTDPFPSSGATVTALTALFARSPQR